MSGGINGKMVARRTRRSRSAGMAMPGGICCTSCSGLTWPPMLSSSWPADGSVKMAYQITWQQGPDARGAERACRSRHYSGVQCQCTGDPIPAEQSVLSWQRTDWVTDACCTHK